MTSCVIHANYQHHKWNRIAAISVRLSASNFIPQECVFSVACLTDCQRLQGTWLLDSFRFNSLQFLLLLYNLQCQNPKEEPTPHHSTTTPYHTTLVFNWICLRISIINWHAVKCVLLKLGSNQKYKKKNLKRRCSRRYGIAADKWMETYLS